MGDKKQIKKLFFFFVIAFLLFVTSGCTSKKENDSPLEKEKYADILGVYHDVYVVNNNGLMSLSKDNKKISKDYFSLRSLVKSKEKNDNWNYFLAQDSSLNFYIVNSEGQETKLSDKYLSLYSVYPNVVVFNISDLKYALYFINEKEEVICDYVTNLENRILRIHKDTADGIARSLITYSGETICDNFTFINDIFINDSVTNKNKLHYIVGVNEKYILIDADGKVLSNKPYDSIQHIYYYNLIECSDFDDTKKTYINYAGDSIVVDTTTTEVEYVNQNLMVLSNKQTRINDINLFKGKIIKGAVYNLFNYSYYYCIKYQTANEVGFLSHNGELIYSSKNLDVPHDIRYIGTNDKDYFYLIESDGYTVVNGLGENKKVNIPKDYIVTPYYINNIFKIQSTDPNNKKIGVFSFENVPTNISDVKFYDEIVYYDSLILGINNGDRSVTVIDSESSNTFKVNVNVNQDIFSTIDFSFNKSYSSVHKETIMLYDFNIRVKESDMFTVLNKYILYWYNDEGMRYFELDKDDQFYFRNDLLLIKDKNVNTKIYKPNEDVTEFTLLATTNKEITKIINDDEDYYYVYNLNNYKGLLNAEGTIILHAQFSDIKDIRDGHVIVVKDDYFGLLKLQKDSKYKVIMNIEYTEMEFVKNILIVCNHLDEYYLYTTSGDKLIKDRIINANLIEYTTIDPEEENGYAVKVVVKLFFGSYVKLLHLEDRFVV